ncbi:hypothetical protein AURDEDRAFT_181516 [Auricularia subglabra TFB-10046 SS5]|nr:hypothetical protein AURDEDRAFT_181516 [Auricularia subglabra TFB-10046 SS5]
MARRQRVSKADPPPAEEDPTENETCFIIPFEANPPKSAQDGPNVALPQHPAAECDIDDGPAIRLRACAAALKKCLDRMQDVLAQLRAKTVDDIHHFVVNEHRAQNPLMPARELPTAVIAGSDPGLVKNVMDGLCERLESDECNKVIHLHPTDCLTVAGALKSLIGRFLGTTEGYSQQPGAIADLAPLQQWAQACTLNRGSDIRAIVLFHDVEMFDAQVLQELFAVSSLNIEDIPLVYCLGTSARSDFLRTCLPRATLATLRTRKFVMSQSATSVFEAVMRKLFFDVDFSPDVMLGPGAFEVLLDDANRFNASTDFLRSALRLVHMHHFTEPVSTVSIDELLGKRDRAQAAKLLDQSDSRAFRERLLACMGITPNSQPYPTVSEILDLLARHRADFGEATRRMRIAFNLLELLQQYLREQQLRAAELRYGFGHLAHSCLAGLLVENTATELCTLIQKLSGDQLRGLVARMHNFFYDLSPPNRLLEQAIRTRIIEEKAALAGAPSAEEVRARAESISKWTRDYFSERLVKLDDLPFYSITCTGRTTYSPELLNANPRASLIAALLSPQDILPPADGEAGQELSAAPDTSVLFRRYLDTGKLINIHDWYQSFSVHLLDSPSAPATTTGDGADEDGDDSDETRPAKRARRRSRLTATPKKPKRTAPRPTAPAGNAEHDAEAKARFLRSFHELEYLGFIRHTRRKVEHVQRTVYEAPHTILEERDGVE